MSPRDVREVRILFEGFDDVSIKSSDPEEGGEVVHSAEPSARGISPEEIPEDRRAEPRPPPPPPLVDLYFRGPFEFGVLGGSLGPTFVFWPNQTAAGPRGMQLAPGTGAFADRPLTQYEPRAVVIRSTNVWDKFSDPPPYNEQQLAAKIRQLARHGLSLSWLSNLITRSDYVTQLAVQNYGNAWVTDEIWLAERARYFPFKG
jgi:hypothetical protein